MKTIILIISVIFIFSCGGSSDQESNIPYIGDPETVLVFPDTQIYSAAYPELFDSMTGWISENYIDLNIKLSLHVGDIVNSYDDLEQWENAKRSLSNLDGLFPSLMAIGNHDINPYENSSLFGNYFDQGMNDYLTINIQGRKWLILTVEPFADQDDYNYANNIILSHQEYSVIILTHRFLNLEKGLDEGQHYAPRTLWDNVVSIHENIKMVISGHYHAQDYNIRIGVHGNKVHEMLVNYQHVGMGGDGYVRLLKFTGDTVSVQDYSTSLDEWNPEIDFEIELF